jgi:hypothetical protein
VLILGAMMSMAATFFAGVANPSYTEEIPTKNLRLLPAPWTATPPTRIEAPAFAGIDSATPEITPLHTPVPRVEGPIIIGASVEGRPLEVYRFGNGPDERMIVAGIHGGYEWNTIALAEELITRLSADPDQVPPHLSLYILANLNPDGEARGHNAYGRANANQVDLNRNWDSEWRAILSRAGCWNQLQLSGGSSPGSEPETSALEEFISKHRIEALISYHSAALGIFAGGLPSTDDSLRLAEAVASVSNYPYPPINTGCAYSGTFTDWAAAQDIAAVDIELNNHYNIDLETNLRILERFLNWER